MIRLIVFLLAVLALGFGFAWFADRPGEVTLVWQGTQFQTSLMVVLAALVALIAAVMLVWWAIATVLRSPTLMRRFLRNRKRDRGYLTLSQGMLAASSGDSARARLLARDSRNLLGDEPLVQLLDIQTLLLEGNRDRARERLAGMLEHDGTKLVALRGLYLEAEREGQKEAARQYAGEAVKLSPALPWASRAVLQQQSAMGDWDAALTTLERSRSAGVITRAEAERKRAVLLTAQAMEEEQAAPEKAARLAAQAHKLAPSLVPAALTGAAAYARIGDTRRAARMLEDVWKRASHPDIAAAYVQLRAGDSALDRLDRARKLASMRQDDPEGNFAVAEAAVAAQHWEEARKAMMPVIAGRPTQRACLLMADIEQGEYGDRGRMRDWFARAVRAPRDAAWIADAYVSDHWMPVSPETGEIDAFEWKSPAEQLWPPLERAELALLAEPIRNNAVVEQDQADDGEDMPEPLQDRDGAIGAGPQTGKPGDADDGWIASQREPAGSDRDGETGDEDDALAASGAVRESGKILPLVRPPDDPGVDPDEKDADSKAFRLF